MFEGLPCFLFGESMGGAVALKAHLKNPSMWDGAILVAPMCKIAETMYPPWYLVKIMIALAHIIPKAKLVPSNNIATIGCRDLEKRKIVSQVSTILESLVKKHMWLDFYVSFLHWLGLTNSFV